MIVQAGTDPLNKYLDIIDKNTRKSVLSENGKTIRYITEWNTETKQGIERRYETEKGKRYEDSDISLPNSLLVIRIPESLDDDWKNLSEGSIEFINSMMKKLIDQGLEFI